MESKKSKQMMKNLVDSKDQFLTTNHGVKINDTHNSLKSHERGSILLEDFIMREKLAHFDRERIPERVVHARGTGVHGVFKLKKSLEKYTTAQFLTDTKTETPLFIRFSTVAGFRGSTDLARDVRGFAVKFYTQEGNFDLVGNNIPVFFIQDAIKFPDLVHSVKPEQDNEMPQAGSAHDTFWDFISLMPESIHMIMWAMSDRAIPRSYRMMEGFGVHTYKLINKEGKAHFVKFHFKPKLGVHSVAWDEAQRISGKDSDFHRRDLLEAILEGNYPEWDFGVQIVPEEDEHKFDFDLLDATKLIPEELVPVEIIGTMTLNRVPDNFFAEVEQVAFCPANIVSGIDFSDDPLLQGRIFSYTDTQFHRLGTANFNDIPINRPLNDVHNNNRDGIFRQQMTKGKVNYAPNSIGGGCPFQAKMNEGGFTSHSNQFSGMKIRGKSEKFFDHFSQAILFYNSQADHEKQHIKDALSFELSKLESPEIRQRMVNNLTNVDMEMAKYVAQKVGATVPNQLHDYINHAVPADANPKDYQPVRKQPSVQKSAALSMANTTKGTISTRQIAILIADGFDEKSLNNLKDSIKKGGAKPIIIAEKLTEIKSENGGKITPDKTFFNCASVLVDAVITVGGKKCVENLSNTPEAIHFLDEAYKHCKAIGFDKGSKALIDETHLSKKLLLGNGDKGVTTDGNSNEFLKNVGQHRFWERESIRKIPS
jgi:catalase